jgi:hypothetical protein
MCNTMGLKKLSQNASLSIQVYEPKSPDYIEVFLQTGMFVSSLKPGMTQQT